MLLSFVRFMFPYRIFYRGIPGFATDCLCGVGCRGLTTCLLHVGPLFVHRRTRTNLSDATAVPVVTSSGDERFEFSSTYTFMFNSSRNYSLNWRHIVMNLQHPVYYCFVNNILKHEGDILHICDHNVMWFEWLSVTGMEQCTFHWSISSELLQKQRVFNGLIIHHLIMITCISYGNISAIFVPKCINIAPL